MKNNSGFNLLELLVAIAISAAVITAITSSYGNLLSGYTFNNSKTQLYQSMRLSMNLIKRDLQNAGTFGSYSLHSTINNSFLNGSQSTCNDNWCNFDLNNLGVGVFAANAGNLSSLIQNTNSQILRVQFGGNRIAYYNGRINGCGGGQISRIDFNVPAGNTTTASSYVLASSNRAYLVNLASASANNSINLATNCNIAIEALNGAVMTVPDQATMTLVPLITHYYYVGTQNGKSGLYTVNFDGTNANGPTLISSLITNLSMNFIVDVSGANFNHQAANNTYLVCPTASMGSGNCLWNRVLGVTVTLTGQANSGAGGAITQTLTDSVGWSW
ncbi:MAG: prepilin-type N-terminal cleavage/methylation domain-containing protein [Neisseriales bacterium]|nr:MAG: prepilin-type N-terminal cleavage/methylation domain-containing protein [Neisseriales bacterium]